jgi:hypothetical protein
MISDPFCVVAPHADTFDQPGVTKIAPIIEFIAALPALDGLTHSGNLMNDERCGSDFVCHSCASALVGRVKQKLAPRGELSAAHKRPPCDSTIERLMRSPMPVP